MRHRNATFKVGRTSSHVRCLLANLLKALIDNERIETTVTKAKELRRHADRMITLAKRNDLSSRRQAISKMMIQFNRLNSKEARAVKGGNTECYNTDRRVLSKLFDTLGPRFLNREGGYTRIVRIGKRVGDNAETCVIEYLSE